MRVGTTCAAAPPRGPDTEGRVTRATLAMAPGVARVLGGGGSLLLVLLGGVTAGCTGRTGRSAIPSLTNIATLV